MGVAAVAAVAAAGGVAEAVVETAVGGVGAAVEALGRAASDRASGVGVDTECVHDTLTCQCIIRPPQLRLVRVASPRDLER
eukprot:COSAG06_NODE_29335_length_558_cov_1.202614_1_plen_80_part_10